MKPVEIFRKRKEKTMLCRERSKFGREMGKRAKKRARGKGIKAKQSKASGEEKERAATRGDAGKTKASKRRNATSEAEKKALLESRVRLEPGRC